jgi:hypothetical protein
LLDILATLISKEVSGLQLLVLVSEKELVFSDGMKCGGGIQQWKMAELNMNG